MPYEHLVKYKEPSNRDAKSIRPTQIIFHSFAGGWNGSVGWIYSQSLESHIAVRNDGFRQQFMSYTKAADANRNANRRPDGTGAISCETESTVAATEPWTDDQINSMIEWASDRCIEFSIPTIVCKTPSSPGLGYHTLFGSPSEWTPVAKSCPGPARIKQFNTILVPGIKNRVEKLLNPPTKEGFLVALSDAEQREVYNALVAVTSNGGRYYKTDATIDVIRSEVVPLVKAAASSVEAVAMSLMTMVNETQGYFKLDAISNMIRGEVLPLLNKIDSLVKK